MTNSSNVDWLVIDAGVAYPMSVMDAETIRLRATIGSKVSQGVKLGAPALWRCESPLAPVFRTMSMLLWGATNNEERAAAFRPAQFAPRPNSQNSREQPYSRAD